MIIADLVISIGFCVILTAFLFSHEKAIEEWQEEIQGKPLSWRER